MAQLCSIGGGEGFQRTYTRFATQKYRKKKLDADNPKKRGQRRIRFIHSQCIIKKLNVLNTKPSDGNENRWRQKWTEWNDDESIVAPFSEFLSFASFSFSFCRLLLFHCATYTVLLLRSCFKFLGFTAHITFISVRKNRTIIVIFYFPLHRHGSHHRTSASPIQSFDRHASPSIICLTPFTCSTLLCVRTTFALSNSVDTKGKRKHTSRTRFDQDDIVSISPCFSIHHFYFSVLFYWEKAFANSPLVRIQFIFDMNDSKMQKRPSKDPREYSTDRLYSLYMWRCTA